METALTEKLASETGGNYWAAKDEEGNVTKARVYYKKGYAEIRNESEIYFETVHRASFQDVLDFAERYNLTRKYN